MTRMKYSFYRTDIETPARAHGLATRAVGRGRRTPLARTRALPEPCARRRLVEGLPGGAPPDVDGCHSVPARPRSCSYSIFPVPGAKWAVCPAWPATGFDHVFRNKEVIELATSVLIG